MKFTWEVTDIKPTDPAASSMLGCVVANTGTTASNRFSILGYEYSDVSQHITLTSLADGLKIASFPVEEMVKFLNDKGYAPVMRRARIYAE